MYIIHHNSSTCTCTCTMISKCWYSVCSSFINNILYSTWVILLFLLHYLVLEDYANHSLLCQQSTVPVKPKIYRPPQF